ncbi:MAG TPA: CAAX prenyl protease-related protein [Tepidisphaeraceae bacterium]|nr:CAAX prenyl protease-related protein [Tepidisphaeraceae bacterium]
MTLESEAPTEQSRPLVRDDVAYFLPMGLFMAFTWVGATWPSLYPMAYVVKVIVVAIALAVLWRQYTPISWRYWWLGVIVGMIGIVQWIGMQLWLQRNIPFFAPPDDPFDPTKTFAGSSAMLYGFLTFRLIGAVLVVPVMEELFWRDFLWRQILAPNDFKLAEVGERSWSALLLVSIVFAFVHGNWWLTSIVWALMIGGLLMYTKSLGACIIAHAVTNLLLAVYVLKFRDWGFW